MARRRACHCAELSLVARTDGSRIGAAVLQHPFISGQHPYNTTKTSWPPASPVPTLTFTGTTDCIARPKWAEHVFKMTASSSRGFRNKVKSCLVRLQAARRQPHARCHPHRRYLSATAHSLAFAATTRLRHPRFLPLTSRLGRRWELTTTNLSERRRVQLANPPCSTR